jgi:hypothetical protein
MNAMKAMFGDMRGGGEGGGMPAGGEIPPSDEAMASEMVCPACGAKFVKKEEEEPMPEEGEYGGEME